MLRCCALVSLFCSVLLFSGVVDPVSVYADDAPVVETSKEAAPIETSEEPEEAAEEDAPPSLTEVTYALDNMILFIAAVLVLFMQAGFAMVETGLNSEKNAVNILFKNMMDLCVGVLLFWVVGYGIMYPGDAFAGGYFGFAGVGVSETVSSIGAGVLHPQVDWLFQVAFAATAATIVSGAVAGRMKFTSYLVYSALLTGIIYPITGMWKWGGGWLGNSDPDIAGVFAWFGAPFHDFAGSVVVHAVGGFAALAGAIVLGPRLGRFAADGKPQPMPGHSLPLAALGVFILWIGWYGFNPGSQLAFAGEANTNATVLIAANTTLAAAAGGVAATILSWLLFKKPDLTMAMNGVLAGLVGITANCDQVSNGSAMIIGVVAGVLVVMGILALDKLRIDDPVGAFPVHGLCGIWGGIATGIFGTADKLSMNSQIVGSIAIPAFTFVTMFILFSGLKAAGQLRVSPEEEQRGLDISEHGMSAYVSVS